MTNTDLDQWEVAVKPASETCRTPLVFLVEPEETWDVVDMDPSPRMLDGSFHYPREHHNKCGMVYPPLGKTGRFLGTRVKTT
jgi:hypothetical protein